MKRLAREGGLETRVAQYARRMAKHGHAVALLTEENAFAKTEDFPRLHLNFHGRNFEEKLAEIVSRCGIDVVEFHINSRRNFRYTDFGALKKRCCVGCCVHGNIRGLDCENLKKADYRIFISDVHPAIDYARLAPYCVLPSAVDPAEKIWHFRAQRKALFVGRLHRDKYHQLCTFIRYCRSRGIGFDIAGNTHKRRLIRKLREKFGLPASVFIGPIDTMRFLAENASRYLFVAGVGQVILEAGTLGYPCLLTPAHGASEATFLTRENFLENGAPNGGFGRNFTCARVRPLVPDFDAAAADRYDVADLINRFFGIENRFARYLAAAFADAPRSR